MVSKFGISKGQYLDYFFKRHIFVTILAVMSLIKQEEFLYTDLLKSKTDKDFFRGFLAYMNFLETKGKVLVKEMKVKEIEDGLEKIESLERKILAEIKNKYLKIVTGLVFKNKKVKVLDLEIRYILNKKYFTPGNIFFVLKNNLVSLAKNRQIKKQILALEKSIDSTGYDFAKEQMDNQFANTNTFDYFFLKRTYRNIKEMSLIKKPSVEKMLQLGFSPAIYNEWKQVMDGDKNEKHFFIKNEFLERLENVHKEIQVKAIKEKAIKLPQRILEVVGSDLKYFGEVKYNLTGNDPKFVLFLVDIIMYFPESKKEMQIREFDKLISKKRISKKNEYRNNIGKTAKSFKKFLLEKGIKNLNPKNKEEIISATSASIFFNNLY